MSICRLEKLKLNSVSNCSALYYSYYCEFENCYMQLTTLLSYRLRFTTECLCDIAEGDTDMQLTENVPSDDDILRGSQTLSPGGAWAPEDCVSSQTVAIIIPYRDRSAHLSYLLSHLHPLMQRQQRDYRVFVVEQVSTTL